MKKSIFLIACTAMILSICSSIGFAITIADEERVTENQDITQLMPSTTVYLMDWQGNKLSTTKGVFLTNGIRIINQTGLQPDDIAFENKPPVIEFVEEDGKIRDIYILPNHE